MTQKIAAGDLILAPPNMLDPRFANTVIMITAHLTSSSFGLCMNRVTEHTINEIIEPLDIQLTEDFELYWGGPVNPNTVWMLHSTEWRTENTMIIDDNWSITSNRDMFHKMNLEGTPQRFRVMFGHCSWDQDQLRKELEGEGPWDHDHSWLTVKRPNPDWLIDFDPTQLWNSACSLSGQQAVSAWLN
jgi:putative transcriptional regulator